MDVLGFISCFLVQFFSSAVPIAITSTALIHISFVTKGDHGNYPLVIVKSDDEPGSKLGLKPCRFWRHQSISICDGHHFFY